MKKPDVKMIDLYGGWRIPLIQVKQLHKKVPHTPLVLMYRVYKYILPEVRHLLAGWRTRAYSIPNAELRKQALMSLTTKQFHCEGGAIYAAAQLQRRDVLVPLIVAFQTISDYLDNLCDRSCSLQAEDFRQLHQSMLDAVQPQLTGGDYYRYRADKEDGNYLYELVQTCRHYISQLPSYHIVQPYIVHFVRLYVDLQVYKHIHPHNREQALLDWWQLHKESHTDLTWYEFAAATGSTLGVFQFFMAATNINLTLQESECMMKAYFPYVCGLHIMLDYLIDQAEDRVAGDLNFCNYYADQQTVITRIGYLAQEAISRVRTLTDGRFHQMIIEGLLALYLSDPKVKEQEAVQYIGKQIMKKGSLMRFFFWWNSRWIRKMMY